VLILLSDGHLSLGLTCCLLGLRVTSFPTGSYSPSECRVKNFFQWK
jgi:hypothetical protein